MAGVLYLMNADGSDLHILAKDVVDHAQSEMLGISGSPGLSWSPDGSRMAYATFSGAPDERRLQIWTRSPDDGSIPILLFESAPFEDG